MATAAAVAMVGSTLALSGSALAGPGTTESGATRVSGPDRYASSVAVAASFANGGTLAAPATTIGAVPFIVASGLDFPDGLSAAAAGMPVLLTAKDALSDSVKTFLTGFTGKATVVGGQSSISSDVFEELEDLATGTGDVVRVQGTDRYKTALAIAGNPQAATAVPSPVLIGSDSAVITTGMNFPDALAAGPLAKAVKGPILLNDGDALNAGVKQYLIDNIDEATETVYIVGGTSAVSQAVEDEISGTLGLTVKRLSGDDRDATASAIASWLGANAMHSNVVLVNRSGFSDALSAGPLASSLSRPILTVGASSVPTPTADYHITNCNTIADAGVVLGIVAIGGTSSIGESVLTAAKAATKCTGSQIVSATKATSDVKQRIALVSTGAGAAITPSDVQLVGVGDGAANAWKVTFTQGATTAITVTAATKTIDFTGDFTTGITRAAFKAAWNGNADAAAIFLANEGTSTAATPFSGAPPLSIIPNVATDALGEQLASVDLTVVVTFSKPVTDGAGAAPVMNIFSDSNPASNPAAPLVSSGVVTAPAAYPATGATEVTYYFDDVEAVIDAFSTARYENGVITDVASNTTNGAPAIKVMTDV